MQNYKKLCCEIETHKNAISVLNDKKKKIRSELLAKVFSDIDIADKLFCVYKNNSVPVYGFLYLEDENICLHPFNNSGTLAVLSKMNRRIIFRMAEYDELLANETKDIYAIISNRIIESIHEISDNDKKSKYYQNIMANYADIINSNCKNKREIILENK